MTSSVQVKGFEVTNSFRTRFWLMCKIQSRTDESTRGEPARKERRFFTWIEIEHADQDVSPVDACTRWWRSFQMWPGASGRCETRLVRERSRGQRRSWQWQPRLPLVLRVTRVLELMANGLICNVEFLDADVKKAAGVCYCDC